MLTVLDKTGRHELAEVYLAAVRADQDLLIEFVDACDPSAGGRDVKWVVIISTQLGCPVKCLMCDAGRRFQGNLSSDEMLAQVDRIVAANGRDPRTCGKFKVQFARTGEPALNDEVLRCLWHLKNRYPNVIPCVATVGPAGRERWFSTLLGLRDSFNDFQLQFSINTTDEPLRERLMPYPKMPWQQIAQLGRGLYRPGRRKPALNFAVNGEWELDAGKLAQRFDSRWFAVKLTPLNPTATGAGNGFSAVSSLQEVGLILAAKAAELRDRGYEVIVSLGHREEDEIGSNCGQAVWRRLSSVSRNTESPAP
jgi:23S rRNA (adenine2503-C2)-methyltransferase